MEKTKCISDVESRHPPPWFQPHAPHLVFDNWREMLNHAALEDPKHSAYTQAIEGYLDYCRRNGLSVELESARGFVSEAVRGGLTSDLDRWKAGLNWFFREGRNRSAPSQSGPPGPGQADTGRNAWEARLIERLRLKHYSWRDRVRGLYEGDRAAGLAGVWLPEALERKYPGAGTAWEWYWLFPSRQLAYDPRSGLKRRHHVLDATFQHAIRQATRKAKLDKRVTPHTLRQNAECRKMPSEFSRSARF